MDGLRIFENPNFGSVRIIEDAESNQLLFCANDVTNALGYANGRDAVARHVEQSDVVKHDTPIPNQYGALVMQSVTYVTESGLYALIFGSKQERAKEFKHWVTSEVLPTIRKTGSYTNQQQPSLTEQVNVNLAFADWNIKQFNLNEASKLGWARKIGEKFGLVTDALPQAVNAGTAHPTTHAATDLLKANGIDLSTRAFNKVLEIKGVVKQCERPGKGKNVHRWMVLQPAFDKYGENQQDPKFQSQTQIRWYDATFVELLTIVGLNKQQSLNLNS